MTKLRSILFNVLFYCIWVPVICTLMLPTLLLPRPSMLWVARFFQKGAFYLEKYILGLTYEVRGLEHQPPRGSAYLVGAKHYSAYETLKLFLLFDDPAIILKRELLSIPLFGWFLKKLDVIAIDRGNRNMAMNSLYEGARRVKAENRPIVIFPQGTRVKVDATTAEKPYKGGIIKLYSEIGLPIVPLALNTGLYWPRNSFWKTPGKVIFEFLPPIAPGLSADEALKTLERQLEEGSAKLVAEGRAALEKA